jgi:hypothetical protein
MIPSQSAPYLYACNILRVSYIFQHSLAYLRFFSPVRAWSALCYCVICRILLATYGHYRSDTWPTEYATVLE